MVRGKKDTSSNCQQIREGFTSIGCLQKLSLNYSITLMALREMKWQPFLSHPGPGGAAGTAPTPHLSAILSSPYNNLFLPPAFPAADFQHHGDIISFFLFPSAVNLFLLPSLHLRHSSGGFCCWELRLQSTPNTGFVNSDGISFINAQLTSES